MFNKSGKVSEITPNNSSLDVCNIALGTTIEGNVKVKSNLRLEGIINGSVTCSGRLVMSKTAQIIGDIVCANMISEGKVEGNVTVKEKIQLLATASITGNVKYSVIQIDAGATLNGQLSCIQLGVNSNQKEISTKNA